MLDVVIVALAALALVLMLTGFVLAIADALQDDDRFEGHDGRRLR